MRLVNISYNRLQKKTNVSSTEINRNFIMKMQEMISPLFCIIIQETHLGIVLLQTQEEF